MSSALPPADSLPAMFPQHEAQWAAELLRRDPLDGVYDGALGDEPLSEAPLYSPMQVAAATLVGGTLAGFLLLAINFARAGRWLAAGSTALTGVVATGGLVMILFELPAGIPAVSLYLPLMLAMFLVAQGLQGRLFARQLLAGAPVAAGWEPIVLPLACLGATVAAALVYSRV